jgi:hypothetical protein
MMGECNTQKQGRQQQQGPLEEEHQQQQLQTGAVISQQLVISRYLGRDCFLFRLAQE